MIKNFLRSKISNCLNDKNIFYKKHKLKKYILFYIIYILCNILL